MANKSAIVIGAGILGIAAARALAINGYSVDVYERNHQASGASVRNFGMIWPIGQPSGKLYDRALRSRDIWKEIGNNGGLWYDPVGSLHLAYNAKEWQVLQELYVAFRFEKREVQLLNKEQVLAKSTIANKELCFGGLFCSEEMIVDPRDAMEFLPKYFHETLKIRFHLGNAVTHVQTGNIIVANKKIQADLIIVCSGSDFETIFPDEFAKYPLTKCKLQMMRLIEEGTRRIGPALCGGLSLIHYASFKVAESFPILKKYYETEMSEYLSWGIHVMISQNQPGLLTVGDSHEYGMSPDPFDKSHINELILKYLAQFSSLKNAHIVESWNGVYGKFTSNQTELFISPEPGVYILNGVGGTGMTLSFGLAEEMMNTL